MVVVIATAPIPSGPGGEEEPFRFSGEDPFSFEELHGEEGDLPWIPQGKGDSDPLSELFVEGNPAELILRHLQGQLGVEAVPLDDLFQDPIKEHGGTPQGHQ